MKRNQPTYSVSQLGSALFMMAALLWLTVSAPFIYASNQQLIKVGMMVDGDMLFTANEEETAKSIDSTTEEKTPGSTNSVSEEYLHFSQDEEYFSSLISRYHKCENEGSYIAFHGELLVPPPDFS